VIIKKIIHFLPTIFFAKFNDFSMFKSMAKRKIGKN